MTSWKCNQCGEVHDSIANSFAFDEPIYWGNRRRWPAPRGCSINKDYCVIDNDGHFIRAVLEIPILDSDQVFTFGVWSTLSEVNFKREQKLASNPERISEPPYFGWFSNRIWQYPRHSKSQMQCDFPRTRIEAQHRTGTNRSSVVGRTEKRHLSGSIHRALRTMPARMAASRFGN
jgi:hypothetical protein